MNRYIKIVICAMLAGVLGSGTVSAQNSEFRWLSAIFGTGTLFPSSTNWSNIAVDTAGNTYFGQSFGGSYKWEDYQDVEEAFSTDPCLRDQLRTARCAVIAKLDTSGHRVWTRTVYGREMTDARISNLLIRDSLLYFCLAVYLSADIRSPCRPFLWLFDTMYYYPVAWEQNHYNYNWGTNIPDSLLGFPFNGSDHAWISMLVEMDLDGNVKDINPLLYGYSKDIFNGSLLTDCYPAVAYETCFQFDSKKRMHIFGVPYEVGPALVAGRDTLHIDQQPWLTPFLDTVHTGSLYIILDSNLHVESVRPMLSDYDRRTVVSLPGATRPYRDNGCYLIPKGITIAENDNVYLSATCSVSRMSYIRSWLNGTGAYTDSNYVRLPLPEPPPISYPYYINLDSAHAVVVENLQASECIPVLIKYDSAGNIVWVKQRYLEGTLNTDTMTWTSEVETPKVAPLVDSQYVYFKGNVMDEMRQRNIPGNHNFLVRRNYYFDAEHRHRLNGPEVDEPDSLYGQYITYGDLRGNDYRCATRFSYYAVYDKGSGEYVKTVIPMKEWMDTVKWATFFDDSPGLAGKPLSNTIRRDGEIFDRLCLMVSMSVMSAPNWMHLMDISNSRLMTTNIEDGSSAVIDSSMYAWGSDHVLTDKGMYICSSDADWASMAGPVPPPVPLGALDGHMPIRVGYYMPAYDRRRVAPCAGVESVAADRGMGSATLRWRGGEGQQLWQVARVAADSTGREPDSAAWEQALLTETADTVLTLALDTCVWLRVRGMCDEGHYGPWSAAVVACPLVGIASGAEAGGVVLTPNPASGLVAVADALSGTPLHGVREVQVVSALGTTVLSTKGSAYFSVNALPAGTYFVKAATRRGTYLLKLVVEH